MPQQKLQREGTIASGALSQRCFHEDNSSEFIPPFLALYQHPGCLVRLNSGKLAAKAATNRLSMNPNRRWRAM
jgi:hypothetical protein